MSSCRLVCTVSRMLPSVAFVLALGAASLHGASTTLSGPDSTALHKSKSAQGNRMHAYVGDMIGVGAIVTIGLTAAVAQIDNDPEEWGKSGSGFAKRVASAAGAHSAQVTVRHGLAAALNRSTSYVRCTCTDAGGRFANGIVSTFTDRDSHEHRVFSEPLILGAAAGGFAPLIWRPSYSVGEAAVNSAISLGITAAGNIAREFISWWP